MVESKLVLEAVKITKHPAYVLWSIFTDSTIEEPETRANTRVYAESLDNCFPLYSKNFRTVTIISIPQLFGIAKTPEEANKRLYKEIKEIAEDYSNRHGIPLEDRTEYASEHILSQ